MNFVMNKATSTFEWTFYNTTDHRKFFSILLVKFQKGCRLHTRPHFLV